MSRSLRVHAASPPRSMGRGAPQRTVYVPSACRGGGVWRGAAAAVTPPARTVGGVGGPAACLLFLGGKYREVFESNNEADGSECRQAKVC